MTQDEQLSGGKASSQGSVYGYFSSASSSENLKLERICNQHFKFPLLVSTDVKLLINRFSTLKVSFEELPRPVRLIIQGMLPFVFNNKIYHCPIRIVVSYRYPYSVPDVSIVPNRRIKLVEGHPIVRQHGEISMSYLDGWTRKSTLVEMVRVMQKIFNQQSPIYNLQCSEDGGSAAAALPKTDRGILSRKREDRQKLVEELRAYFTRAMNDVGIDSKSENSMSCGTEEIVRQLERDYVNDKRKLDAHRMCLNMWMPLGTDLGTSLKSQYSLNNSLYVQLAKQQECLKELEEIDGCLFGVIDSLDPLTKLSEELKQEKRVMLTNVLENLYGRNEKGGMLCGFVATEAASDSMLDVLVDAFKRKLVSTKNFVNHVRHISREKFYGFHERMKAAKEL